MNVFVFGSNLAGRHGAGAAKFAREHHGAVYGQGVGFQGSSYAIPTKDRTLALLPLDRIAFYVNEFTDFAIAHPEMKFQVTPIGCGLARGNETREERVREIAPLFKRARNYRNIQLPKEFDPKNGTTYKWRDFDAWIDPSPNFVPKDVKNLYVGIVGSSHAQYTESYRKTIDGILSKYNPATTVIVSGGAKGVDTFGVNQAKAKGFEIIEFKPVHKSGETRQEWISINFKRNKEIADKCNKVYCIVEPVKDKECYHCSNNNLDDNHQKTAGCWTAINCKDYEIIHI